MKKVSVGEAAEYFGVSKEAIHNRIRRGSLEIVVENGVKMVLLNTDKPASPTKKRVTRTQNSAQNDERYYKLLAEQNAKLQARVDTLENETRSLRDQKELMLIEERKKIEQIYKEKDEQLKNILTTLSSQFMLSSGVQQDEDKVETVEVEIEESKDDAVESVISLKKYLKGKDFSLKKIKKIRDKFKKKSKKDDRIILVGSKYYINPTKYDYSDLI